MYNPYYDEGKKTVCPNCDAVIPLSIKNCPECHAEISYTDQEKRELRRWKKRQVFLAVLFTILAVGVVIFIISRG